jgi:sugar fermentation stimulation protein A
VEGRFVDRPNRFLVRVDVGERLVEAHCANPGSMLELLLPGVPVILQTQEGGLRRTRHTLVAVRHEGRIVPLVSTAANHAAHRLLIPTIYPEATGSVRREVVLGSSRFDFAFELPSGPLLLEVKACTLVAGGTALFPDAPTERGRRHLEELTAIARSGKAQAGVLVVIMRPDVTRFLPNPHTDPAFTRAFIAGARQLQLRACSLAVAADGWSTVASLDVHIDTEAAARAVAADAGVYLLVVRLRDGTVIEPGALGSLHLQAGYYIYVGSAMRGLTARVARHRRKRKKLRWHIDWLTTVASGVVALPIRTPHRLECELAREVGGIAAGRIDRFGCTDCRCRSHLFYFRGSPLQDKRFLATLLTFRHSRALEGSLL